MIDQDSIHKDDIWAWAPGAIKSEALVEVGAVCSNANHTNIMISMY